jgi:glutamate:GABA antiporter
MPLDAGFIPDLTKPGNLVLAASIFLFYAAVFNTDWWLPLGP